jgi:hypothetical protein
MLGPALGEALGEELLRAGSGTSGAVTGSPLGPALGDEPGPLLGDELWLCHWGAELCWNFAGRSARFQAETHCPALGTELGEQPSAELGPPLWEKR